jgi:prolyl oligopeptidase
VKIIILLGVIMMSCTKKVEYVEKSGFSWLEEVRGDDAMSWVNNENSITLSKYEKSSKFIDFKKKTLEILQTKEKIPYVNIINGSAYNLWKDKKNPKGLLRRKVLKDYLENTGEWESVLDLDQLSAKENINWFYRRLNCFRQQKDRCLISLSEEGKDATSVREFDLTTKSFVKDGFKFPTSKSSFMFADLNHLYVADGFEKPNQTSSGYPRVIKVIKRGQTIESATTIFQGKHSDVSVQPFDIFDPITGETYAFIHRGLTFYESEMSLITKGFKAKRLLIPNSAEVMTIFSDLLFLKLTKDWRIRGKDYAKGSLLSFPFDGAFEEKGPKDINVIFKPSNGKALQGLYTTKESVFIKMTEDVKQSFYEVNVKSDKKELIAVELPDSNGTFRINNSKTDIDFFFMSFQSVKEPSSLYHYKGGTFKKVYGQKKFFNSDNLVVKQFFSTSKDGTQIPYTMAHDKNIKLDGNNPTIVYGYGGFRNSLYPWHSSTNGMFWLSRGGVYIFANIRGGGEYGPSWHEAALKEKRQNAYDDFYSIAEDLIKKKVTSPAKLAIKGGSNGGLLTAVAFNQRPDLYSAVISSVPLTDMLRFHKLLAGASWMGEYGNPDLKSDVKFLKEISPFHNVSPIGKVKSAPSLLLKTSTSDDRVHPGHARKMAKKAKEYGHDVLYFENTEGGHGGGDNFEQLATSIAVEYSFLYDKLKMN